MNECKSLYTFPKLGHGHRIWEVYYRKYSLLLSSSIPSKVRDEEYVCVGKLWANSLEDVFIKMQRGNWNPKGEADEHLRSINCPRCSMGSGDMVKSPEGDYYLVAALGWHKVEMVKD